MALFNELWFQVELDIQIASTKGDEVRFLELRRRGHREIDSLTDHFCPEALAGDRGYGALETEIGAWERVSKTRDRTGSHHCSIDVDTSLRCIAMGYVHPISTQ
jgi:hypothetical protein